MKTMQEIDAWYEAEINKARLEGKLEGKLEGEFLGKLKGKIESASTIIRAKFGASSLTPQIVGQLKQLNEQQLDDFIVLMFNWQQRRIGTISAKRPNIANSSRNISPFNFKDWGYLWVINCIKPNWGMIASILGLQADC